MKSATPRFSSLVGQRAPDFELLCVSATHPTPRTVKLADYVDHWLVLMFYPQDFSLVCPTELLALSDRYEEFSDRGAEVLAVSTDSIESHAQWIARPRGEGGLESLRFPLAADPSGSTSLAYGVYVEERHLALRGLFIVDPNSVVQIQVVHNMSVGRSTDDVLRLIQALQIGGLCGESWSPGHDPIDPAEELGPGRVIGHFRIEERIGSGGFATVYRASDNRLKRDVALKVLKRIDGLQPNLRGEAQMAAALNHPNVCIVHSADEVDGVSMIVMEYLRGTSLQERIEQGPIGTEGTIVLARGIAAGMAAAHLGGVVHGDLKPANIMIMPDDTAKILDFGLAERCRRLDEADSTASFGAQPAAGRGGTWSYMSPEQADGAPASIAGDVFSFGIVLYEMLTGRKAFSDSSGLKVLSQIRSSEPDDLALQVPEPFPNLLRKMLVRSPAERDITMARIEEFFTRRWM
jgi:alkyl hydroperoxide reductase subunit AhpC